MKEVDCSSLSFTSEIVKVALTIFHLFGGARGGIELWKDSKKYKALAVATLSYSWIKQWVLDLKKLFFCQ